MLAHLLCAAHHTHPPVHVRFDRRAAHLRYAGVHGLLLAVGLRDKGARAAVAFVVAGYGHRAK